MAMTLSGRSRMVVICRVVLAATSGVLAFGLHSAAGALLPRSMTHFSSGTLAPRPASKE